MSAPGDPSLGWSIGLLFRTWQDGVSGALKAVPHGARGFQILSTVTHSEPPTQAALAAHLGIDRTVLTYVLDDLVTAGLLRRTIDANDRRVRRLVVTAAGRTLLKTSERKVAAAERELLVGLSADDQAALRSLLARAAGQIHHRDPGHDACSVVADILGDATGPGTRARSARPRRAREPS